MTDQQYLPLRRGVVGIVTDADRMLVIRRSNLVEAPGAYCFPGGGIEEGETEADTLRREFREELGVEVRPVRCVWRSRTDWNVDLAWWFAQRMDNRPLQPQPLEVASVHWLTLEEVQRLPGLLSSNSQFLQRLQRGEVSLASSCDGG